jgi:mercuric ion transport protein
MSTDPDGRIVLRSPLFAPQVRDLYGRLTDKVGTVGVLVSAMGCASCFPAIASLGAAIGVGFLAQFEGLFINTLLPIFAVIALIANLLALSAHRRIGRGLLSIAGPCMVLATLYLFWTNNWSTYMFYTGLGAMFVTSLWDVFSPAARACTPASQPNQHIHGANSHEAI